VATELEERLLFVSAGTPVSAVAGVYASDRWDGFLEALSHAGACVMLLLPAQAPGADRMLARADSLVVLGSRDHAPVLGNVDLYRAIGLEPVPPSSPVMPAGDQPRDTSGRTDADEPDDGWELDPAAVGPDPDDEPVMTAERASAMNRAARLSPPPKSRLGLVFFMLFVVLVAIVAAGWLGLIDVPGISPRRSAASLSDSPEGMREASARAVDVSTATLSEATSPKGGAAAAPSVSAELETGASSPSAERDAAAPLQAWGLRIVAFRNREVAREQADLMSGRAPGHLFVVVPVEVQGVRWYRVVSALAEEEGDAEAMRSDLATRLGSTESGQWLVRRAPMAFLVAETSTEAEARGQVEALGSAGVDTFVMALPRPDGARVFRVYAGAYANPQEASTMGALLEAAGIAEAPLVERRGILPE
jgi:cell division septation protein DedD